MPREKRLSQKSQVMGKGYFTPPVLIILAVISISLALVIYINTRLVKDAKENNSPQSVQSPKASPSPNIMDETANWEIYKDVENGFSIKHPHEYVAEKPTGIENPTDLNLSKPDGTGITVIVEDTNKKTLEKYLSSITEGDSITEVTDQSLISIDSRTAERTIKEYRTEGQIAAIVLDGNKVYQILSTFKGNKESVVATFDQILSTFQFLD